MTTSMLNDLDANAWKSIEFVQVNKHDPLLQLLNPEDRFILTRIGMPAKADPSLSFDILREGLKKVECLTDINLKQVDKSVIENIVVGMNYNRPICIHYGNDPGIFLDCYKVKTPSLYVNASLKHFLFSLTAFRKLFYSDKWYSADGERDSEALASALRNMIASLDASALKETPNRHETWWLLVTEQIATSLL